jgi:hypothetical protein
MGTGREGPGPWTDIEALPPGVKDDTFGDGVADTTIVWLPDWVANNMFKPLEDGVYELRAFTECSNGGRGYSDVSAGTIDRHAPVVFGLPQPSDGELSLGENIAITFNEPIDCALVGDAEITLKYLDGPLADSQITVTPVCNGETIILVPGASPNDLEGRHLEASVDSVVDRVGNMMTAPVTWQFEYRQSQFNWSQTRINRAVPLVTPGTVAAELVNGTGQALDYTITDITPVSNFIAVAPGDASGRLLPGGTREIVFDIDPLITGGPHDGQVTVQAVDTTGTDTLVAILDVVLDVSCAAPQWAIDPGSFEHSMSIVSRVLTDAGTLNDGNDMVAAFVGEQLRGVASPQDAGGDTLVFLTVFSDRVGGETVRFEVWDDDQCRRYGSTAERKPFGADDVLGSPNSPDTLTALDTPPGSVASFPLNAGWNWFSTYVTSGDMSVGSVLSSLAPTAGDIIKSKTAFAVFDPDTTIGWVGTLDTLNNTSGYMINLTDAGTLLQEGTFVDPLTTAVPVADGWNWIGYLPTSAKTVTAALADVQANGFLNGDEVLKGQTSFTVWNSGWFGSLDMMEPGKGYRLFLQDPALPSTFNYPAGAAAAMTVARGHGAHLAAPSANKAGWSFYPGTYEYNMTVIATVHSDGVDWRRSDNLVGAFVGDECRGVVPLMKVPGIDHYLAFATIHSNDASGETVTFRAFDAKGETIYDATESMQFVADAVSGAIRDPIVLTPASRADTGLPSVYRLAQNNPVTTIRFELPQASRVVMKIYDVAGHEIRTVVDQNYPAGAHSVIWDAKTSSGRDAASGVYFYRITAGSFTDVRKMVLLR